jgi:hypothetical protein
VELAWNVLFRRAPRRGKVGERGRIEEGSKVLELLLFVNYFTNEHFIIGYNINIIAQ